MTGAQPSRREISTGVIEDADAGALDLCDCDELGEAGMRVLMLHAQLLCVAQLERVEKACAVARHTFERAEEGYH